jgi:hypothetical protein
MSDTVGLAKPLQSTRRTSVLMWINVTIWSLDRRPLSLSIPGFTSLKHLVAARAAGQTLFRHDPVLTNAQAFKIVEYSAFARAFLFIFRLSNLRALPSNPHVTDHLMHARRNAAAKSFPFFLPSFRLPNHRPYCVSVKDDNPAYHGSAEELLDPCRE